MTTLDENGGPDPEQSLDAAFPDIQAEVRAFIAKMQERYGVTAVFVGWEQARLDFGGFC